MKYKVKRTYGLIEFSNETTVEAETVEQAVAAAKEDLDEQEHDIGHFVGEDLLLQEEVEEVE